MFRKFLKDTHGNYALITALVMAPLMGALAMAVDYTELSRQRLDTRNALGIALSASLGTPIAEPRYGVFRL